MFYKVNISDKLNRIGQKVKFCEVAPPAVDYRQFTDIEQKQFAPITTHTNHLQYYQQMAAASYKKSYYSSKKDATFHKYLLCWYNDMKSILNEYDITQLQFFNFIK